MHKLNQPQTTQTNLIRDATAQISDGTADAKKHCINNDLFHVEQPSKSDLIRKGLEKIHRTQYPNSDYQSINDLSFGVLSELCAMLTSTSRNDREYAKTKIRLLMKLGKGE